ncbi:hypothetical protein [Falsiroseomonas tokyonensis]|uniref:TetR family transcriptional regulator n=1 Tax=Falsiroseomonas tokyonensis TaxID=430521 RepID=A0ABV7BX43_9PROT|nr:hypothetical protein [Falsiroseomonas tokyonensis]MBU8539207.1 hypothetical protein [Falsiroseomonas tokyonensis]
MVIEGGRCSAPEAREAARSLGSAAEDRIRRFIAASHPELAEPLADYVVTLMTGLSAMARDGHGAERLLATARLGAAAIARALSA